jgi:putative transposase
MCGDNAVAESFFASLKKEMYHQQSFASRARARLAIAEYIEVTYNRHRRHSTIGQRIPAAVMGSRQDRIAGACAPSQCPDQAA